MRGEALELGLYFIPHLDKGSSKMFLKMTARNLSLKKPQIVSRHHNYKLILCREQCYPVRARFLLLRNRSST